MKTIALVRFTPRAKMSPEEYKGMLTNLMPMFQSAEGLNHKYFAATETGSMGIYEWQSKADAESFYNDDWRALMDKMASEFSVEFVSVRAELDNLSDQVEYFF